MSLPVCLPLPLWYPLNLRLTAESLFLSVSTTVMPLLYRLHLPAVCEDESELQGTNHAGQENLSCERISTYFYIVRVTFFFFFVTCIVFVCNCWCVSGHPSWSAASSKCPPAVWLLGQMTWIVRGQGMFLVLKRMRAPEHQFITTDILIFVIHDPLLCKNLGEIVSYACLRMLLPPAVHQWSTQTYLELASIY